MAQTDTDSVFEASASESEGESVSSKARPPKSPTHAPVDHQAMWYPTVRRTLLCLSKLYRCVERPTFEGLAQEALRAGVASERNVWITKIYTPDSRPLNNMYGAHACALHGVHTS